MSIQNRYKSVLTRINNTKKQYQIKKEIDLLAVSKKQPIEKIKQLYTLGHRKFGESYVQEAINKIEELEDYNIEWHFIGPLQSNKTKHIAKYFDWVQSVDSEKLLNRLNEQRINSQNKLNVLLQLKVGGEESKRGLTKQDLLNLTRQFNKYENLNIRGLMSIPKPTFDKQQQNKQFSYCNDVFRSMKLITDVDILSIGMSSDLESAVNCGSTMVRVGTDIFGKR